MDRQARKLLRRFDARPGSYKNKSQVADLTIRYEAEGAVPKLLSMSTVKMCKLTTAYTCWLKPGYFLSFELYSSR